MRPPFPAPPFALLAGLALSLAALSGCDAFMGHSVWGEVVDVVTGEPVDPGTVEITVYGNAILLDAFPPVIGSGMAEADGRFSIGGLGKQPTSLNFANEAELDYPIPALVDEPWINSLRRAVPKAYFGANVDYPQGNVGRVELSPTCLTSGTLRLAAPIPDGQYLQLEMTALGQPGSETEFVRVGFPSFVHDTQALPAVLDEDAVRFTSRGGHAARLVWTTLRTDTSETIESGDVLLPECPRHGVLEYEAVIGPVANND